MVSSVISSLVCAVAKLSAIVKICKYRSFHERHDFIPMAMEVHGAPKRDMDHFINGCAYLFHDIRLRGHVSLSFCIQFFRQCVSIALQCALAFAIDGRIMLVGDACSRPPITIKSHD